MENIAGETIAVIGPRGIPKEFPGTSGIETYAEAKAIELAKNNTVSCYVRRWAARTDSYKNIRTIRTPSVNSKQLDTVTYSLLASFHAAFGNATIVWYHGVGPALFSFIPKLAGKRVFTTIHSMDWQRKKWGFFAKTMLKLGNRLTMLFSDRIFVVSDSLQKYYACAFHIRAEVEKHELPGQKPVPLGVKWGLRKNKYILYLGRFVPEKRLEWLIRAYCEIKPRGIMLVLAGGSSHSDKYEIMLRKLSNNHKPITNNRIIFTGYIFGREKDALLGNCRTFVLPSSLEGNPISVLEARSFGRKCLLPDFLKPEFPDRQTRVRFFRHDNYEDFRDKLRLMTSPAA